MSRIVAGRFQTLPDAEHAVHELVRAQCSEDDIDLFYTSAPGQHGVFPVGGDEDADPAAKGAERSTLKGAAIGAGLGLLAGSLAGPLGAAAGAAVGGYTGSLAGTMKGLGENTEGDARHAAGVMVAVNVPGHAREREVADILSRNGAAPVEALEGEWRDGVWTDFNPVSAPGEAPARAAPAEPATPQAVYRVFPGGHGHWNVFEGDLGKLLSEFAGREEAIDYAASLARMKSLAVVEIYRAGGVLESSRVFNKSDYSRSLSDEA
jgi:hypothetical protein